MSRLLVNGVRLEVREIGSGPPVLLVHGFTGRGSAWHEFAVSLRNAGHRTITVDLLGHGRSDAPTDPSRYDLSKQAADLAALLEQLDAVPADVVAYSMGARVALRLAIEHPAVIRRLVLESPSPGINREVERTLRKAADEAIAQTLETDGLEAFVDLWQQQPVFASQGKLSPAARARLRRQRLSGTVPGLAASLRGAGQGVGAPVHSELGDIPCPTLVIAGVLDPGGVDRASIVAAGIPDARLAPIANAGHNIHLERPRTFNSLVRSFLAIEPSAAS